MYRCIDEVRMLTHSHTYDKVLNNIHLFPGVTVTVSLNIGELSLVVSLPTGYGNMTDGLFGTFNDDPSDDFTTPDGQVLPTNITDSEIFYQFGRPCK